jgi:outer membrane lipoprotein-sorting protein
MPSSLRSGRLRWAAPVVVAGVIGLVAVVPTLSAGAATPNLAPVSPQQLLAKVQQTHIESLSGTIRLTTNLGIPNLGSLADATGHNRSGFNPTDLLSGAHSADVWFAGPDQQKVTMVSSLAETDVIHNGQDVWTWQSTGSKVEHIVLAAHPAGATKPEATPDPNAATTETPDAAAKALLAQVDPLTAVTVSKPLMVASHKAYELVLTPRSTDPKLTSTVDHVAIAVDSTTGLPLRVQLFAIGQKKVAFELGFTSLKYHKPAASTFKFTPPKGATVTTKTVGATKAEPKTASPKTDATAPATSAGKPQLLGKDWTQIAIFSSSGSNTGQLPRQANALLESAPSVQVGKSHTARLIHTALINVLVLDDGRIAVGAVTASSMAQAVASAP